MSTFEFSVPLLFVDAVDSSVSLTCVPVPDLLIFSLTQGLTKLPKLALNLKCCSFSSQVYRITGFYHQACLKDFEIFNLIVCVSTWPLTTAFAF